MKLTAISLIIMALIRIASAQSLDAAPDPAAPAPASPNDEPVGQIRVELLIVRTSDAKAVALMPDLRDPNRIVAAQERLLELVAKSEAELVDWPVLTAKSGNRAVIENIQELKYPVEFSRPQLERNPPTGSPTATTTPSAPDTGQSPALLVPTLQGVPNRFEVKNLGVSLEAESTIAADGKTIHIQLSPRHVTFRQWNKTTSESSIGKQKYKVVVEQPEFHFVGVTTNVSLASGQPMLLHFAKLKEPAGQVELFILKATIVDEHGREVMTAPEGGSGKAKQEK